ncbi:MAG: hypothetical protein A2Y73_01065 [Chloroflexi bacterium RBG_13_56_8]|nr:MAG: hypothetical protein A2Y73_01065 [Chloroflexi bacterium RBG_13_56_8]
MWEDIIIAPMSEEFILWRCLHHAPLSKDNIEDCPPDQRVDWQSRHAINLPVLRKIMHTYGACAMLAWDGTRVVGFLRFYPKAIMAMEEAGFLCLQQAYPDGASERLVRNCFPPLEEMGDKTLLVHCLMVGSPYWEENPYRRKGIGTRLVRALMRWAKDCGWEAIEAFAFEELDVIYDASGATGKRFWERLGFQMVGQDTLPLGGVDEGFVSAMREQAVALGLQPEDAQNRYTMRFELKG